MTPGKRNKAWKRVRPQLEELLCRCGQTMSSRVQEARDEVVSQSKKTLEEPGATDEVVASKIIHITSAQCRQIKRALERGDAGTYGICENCDLDMLDDERGKARLKAISFATVCVGCKQRTEDRFTSPGSGERAFA